MLTYHSHSGQEFRCQKEVLNFDILTFYQVVYTLGECRTLWGEPERGRWYCCMHASIWRLCCARTV